MAESLNVLLSFNKKNIVKNTVNILAEYTNSCHPFSLLSTILDLSLVPEGFSELVWLVQEHFLRQEMEYWHKRRKGDCIQIEFKIEMENVTAFT